MSNSDRVLTEAEASRISVQLPRVFTPGAPVTSKDSLAGRITEIRRVIEAVTQPGRHVVIFGERGVGKTSLAGSVHDFWQELARDTEAWISPRDYPIDDYFQDAMDRVSGGYASAAEVMRFLSLADEDFIIIIDEYDRILDNRVHGIMSDLVKSLSDHDIEATLVLVGVADTVEQLVDEHASIVRSLEQILVPRMTAEEVVELIQDRMDSVGLAISPEAVNFIVRLAQGLPYYAHLLGLRAGLEATANQELAVEMVHVRGALKTALDSAQESITSAYHRAPQSPRRDNRYKDVALACSLAPVDDLGFFAAADVRHPYNIVTGGTFNIPNYIGHLHKFCTQERGSLLESTGARWQTRFRFSDPLMKPYIAMKGVSEGLSLKTYCDVTSKHYQHAD